jgi:adenine-specific DNA methylase
MSLAPGSPDPNVWHDVVRMRTLNTEQGRRGEEQHLCPLQLDIVERLVRRFSNPGDLVHDPFAGVGTVPLRALKLGRQGRSVELNPGYWLDSVKYLEAEERSQAMPSLFDLDA